MRTWIEKAADFDAELKDLGEEVKKGADQRRAFAAALLKNHFQDEGFDRFRPCAQSFGHVERAVCQGKTAFASAQLSGRLNAGHSSQPAG